MREPDTNDVTVTKTDYDWAVYDLETTIHAIDAHQDDCKDKIPDGSSNGYDSRPLKRVLQFLLNLDAEALSLPIETRRSI